MYTTRPAFLLVWSFTLRPTKYECYQRNAVSNRFFLSSVGLNIDTRSSDTAQPTTQSRVKDIRINRGLIIHQSAPIFSISNPKFVRRCCFRSSIAVKFVNTPFRCAYINMNTWYLTFRVFREKSIAYYVCCILLDDTRFYFLSLFRQPISTSRQCMLIAIIFIGWNAFIFKLFSGVINFVLSVYSIKLVIAIWNLMLSLLFDQMTCIFIVCLFST